MLTFNMTSNTGLTPRNIPAKLLRLSQLLLLPSVLLLSACGDNGSDGSPGSGLLNGTSVPTSSIGMDGDFYIDTTTETLYGPRTSGHWAAGISLKGSAGTNGHTILSGVGAPPNSMGNNGDFYLDTHTFILYGAKANGAWPTLGVALVGATGATGSSGTNGHSVLNGTTAPTSAPGNSGDFYINTSTDVLYGPKTSDGWSSTGVSLIGATGGNRCCRCQWECD